MAPGSRFSSLMWAIGQRSWSTPSVRRAGFLPGRIRAAPVRIGWPGRPERVLTLQATSTSPATFPAAARSCARFRHEHTLNWEVLGLEFLDVADSLAGSDGRDVFTADDRYAFDPSAAPGQGWKWVAHTLDPFRFPDDLRLHLPALQCGTSVRLLARQDVSVPARNVAGCAWPLSSRGRYRDAQRGPQLPAR